MIGYRFKALVLHLLVAILEIRCKEFMSTPERYAKLMEKANEFATTLEELDAQEQPVVASE